MIPQTRLGMYLYLKIQNTYLKYKILYYVFVFKYIFANVFCIYIQILFMTIFPRNRYENQADYQNKNALSVIMYFPTVNAIDLCLPPTVE